MFKFKLIKNFIFEIFHLFLNIRLHFLFTIVWFLLTKQNNKNEVNKSTKSHYRNIISC